MSVYLLFEKVAWPCWHLIKKSKTFKEIPIMKKYKFYLLSILLFSTFSSVLAEGGPTAKRFYAGKILRAEVQPDNPEMPIEIKNISEYEQKSTITSDIAYAIVTVNLDNGRSLGLYDYSLVNKQKREFSCVAFSERENDYDRSEWEITKTRPSRKYSMLFKVQLPPIGEPQYNLRFNLIKNKWKEIPLEFINVGANPFTKYKDIPPEGMLGIDPNKPEPVEPIEEPAEQADENADEKKTDVTADKPGEKPEKKLSKAEANPKSDQEALKAGMGDAGLKTTDKPKEKETKKDSAKKGKKDAWDDWE
jgi:hypothetical protein